MSHTFTNLLYHFIYSTKDRVGWIKDEVAKELHPYMGGAVRELGGTSLGVGGTEDHVHLLVKLPAKLAVSEVLCTLKANSSGWIHRRWPNLRSFAWQTGYAGFSVSQSNVPDVRQYIEHQPEHHRRRTFQEEFIAMLNKHGIECDARYIWE